MIREVFITNGSEVRRMTVELINSKPMLWDPVNDPNSDGLVELAGTSDSDIQDALNDCGEWDVASAITASEYRTRLSGGKYIAVTDCTVALFHGVDSSARQIEYAAYKAGEPFELAKTMNGFWHALMPNGDPFNGYADATVIKLQ